MTTEITPPSTASQTQIFFTNDANTRLEIVQPGNPLPVTGSLVVTPTTATTATATQVTVPATADGILILAANSSRKGVIISNPGSVTVYVQQGATGVTTSNGFGIPAGNSMSIDDPLYTGAIYGIVATGTQVVTVIEFT